MKFLEKVEFIQKSLHLTDGAFCARYKIKLGLLKKWRLNQIKPTLKDVKTICKEFNLEPTDFLNDTSTLSRTIKDGEHSCATKPIIESGNVVYEDYVREDNSRYEEKD